MRLSIAVVLAAIFALVAAIVPQPAQAGPSRTKKVIITLRAKAHADTHLKVLRALSAKPIHTIASNGDSADEFMAIVAEVPASLQVKGGGASNKKDIMNLVPDVSPNDVLGIEEDFSTKWIEAMPSFQGTALPSVEGVLGSLPRLNLSRTAGMSISALRPEIPWGVERVRAPAAWDYSEGRGVRVAVVDTGIFTEHKDLKGKVDGGYDAFTQSESKEAYQDQNGHGTHVAGTIAAIRNNKGVVGVAPRARLYAVRVLDAQGSGSIAGIIDGVIWCANNGMQVANMSLGSSLPSEALQKALRYAKSRGVIVVAAAGNSGGSVGYPAAYPETIAISASDPKDKLAFFSSRGPEVKFIAPGVNVVSTSMTGDFANLSGTSMAAPHVTGLVALAVSQGWVGMDGPDGVMEQLKKAARKLPGLSDNEQGYGMIDALRLVR